ncbi:MAG TPA: hypothetical protein VEC38_02450 [Candidatus Binataceae bacterium]|nr:hypothetical protein [Candidatus Binataceae bacterium]
MRSYEADKAVDEIEEQMGSQGASCYCSRDPAQCHVPQPRELELCENVARTNQAHENAEAALEESDSDNMYDVIHTPPRNAEEAASLKRLREANQAIELTEKAADEAEAEASAQGINCENIVEGWRASPTPCGEPGPNPLCEKLAKAMEESDAQRHQEPVCAAPVNTQGAAVIQWLPSCPEWTDWKKRGDEAQRAIDQVKAQMRSDGTTCFCAQHGTLWRCRPGCSREAELCKQLDAANQAYSQAMAGAHEFAPCYSPCEPIGTGLPGMPKAPVGIADIPGVAPSVMEEKRSRIREARGVLDEARAKVDAEKFDCQGFQPEQ